MSAAAFAPLPYNLLELYRQHRDEVDVLTDETALFILAFTNEMNGAEVDALAGDLNLSLNTLRAKLTPLLRGQMMLEENGSLVVTALGKRILSELGFIPPPIPPGKSKQSEPPKQPPKPPVAETAGAPAWIWGAMAFFGTGALALAAILVIGILVVSGVFPPRPTIITPIVLTPIPPPTVAPLLSDTPTRTPTATPTSTPTITPTPVPRVNTFPLGQKPLSIVFDPGGKRVYVGTYDGTILALDAATQKIVRKASVPGAAVALALSPPGDRLYVAAFETNVVFHRDTLLAVSSARGGVYALDTNTMEVVSKAALQFLGLPRMTISPNGQFLFLTDSADKSTTLLVLETSQLGQVTRAKDGTSPQFTATNRQSSLLFVPAFADDAISEYNIQADQLKVAAAAGAFSPIAKIAAKGGPSAVTLNADESRLYIGLGNEPIIDVANTQTLQIEQTIALPSPVLVTKLSPNGRWLVAISRTTDHVFLIDTSSNRLIDDIGVGNQPSAFDFTPDNQMLWVADSGDDSIRIVALP